MTGTIPTCANFTKQATRIIKEERAVYSHFLYKITRLEAWFWIEQLKSENVINYKDAYNIQKDLRLKNSLCTYDLLTNIITYTKISEKNKTQMIKAMDDIHATARIHLIHPMKKWTKANNQIKLRFQAKEKELRTLRILNAH